MRFRFTKELINDGVTQTNNLRKQLRLYKIIDNVEDIAAQFFYYSERQFLKLADKEIEIKVISTFAKKPQHLLIDNQQQKQVGHYNILATGINYFWQDVPSSPNGTIILNETFYNFRRLKPEVSHSSLRSETWAYYKFRLYSIKGDEFAEYSFKMDVPFWSLKRRNYISFEGIIETNSDNMTAIISAFYLMEWEFKYEDENNSG